MPAGDCRRVTFSEADRVLLIKRLLLPQCCAPDAFFVQHLREIESLWLVYPTEVVMVSRNEKKTDEK